MTTNSDKIGAIMVLFKPNWDITTKAIAALAPQVDLLCIIDNTPNTNNNNHFSEYSNIHYIPLNANKGIAKAQNEGIRYLINNCYDFVLFSDQDSIAPVDIIKKMVYAFHQLEDAAVVPAAIGPIPIQRTTGKVIIDKHNYKDEFSIDDTSFYKMDGIISSFSMIRLKILEKVGFFREDLFIDGVDVEWCWRAKFYHGLNSYLLLSCSISHMLGEDNKGPVNIRIPSPFRVYYQFRNYFKLIRCRHTPNWWKLKNGVKYFFKFFYYSLFISPRKQYLKNMIRGSFNGITNKK